MYTLKVVTTVFIAFMIANVAIFLKDSFEANNKVAEIGFGFMELVYMLSLACMWN